jgi:hypothetical protein
LLLRNAVATAKDAKESQSNAREKPLRTFAYSARLAVIKSLRNSN